MTARCTRMIRVTIDVPSLEVEIEDAWRALLRMPKGRSRRLYLTPTGRLMVPHGALDHAYSALVGSYTNQVELRDFRDDVFFVYGEMMRGR